MNRAAVWVLATVSSVILALAILGPFTLGAGYSTGAACASYDGSPCTPQLQQVTFAFGPLLRTGLGFLLLVVLIGLPAWIASPVLAARRGASSKPVIIPLAVISVALLIVGIYFALVNGLLASPKTCFGTGSEIGPGAPNTNCVTGPSAGWLALLAALFGPALISAVVGLPALVMALVRTARIRVWGWFVAILLLSPIATLLYGFFGPEQERTPPQGAPSAAEVQPAAG